jgi:hypothetical protein
MLKSYKSFKETKTIDHIVEAFLLLTDHLLLSRNDNYIYLQMELQKMVKLHLANPLGQSVQVMLSRCQ